MLRVGGFPEYSPIQQRRVDLVTDTVRNCYEQFGYQHIYTPAVERNEVLTAKGGDETSKQIYGLYGLAQGSKDTKDYALRFDLTIPFARYVLDHVHELYFPFKRRQMQPVWRGERQQKGRYKEFVQADIDTIWDSRSTSDYLGYDAETVVVLAYTFTQILQKLDIKTGLTVKINNRKLITGMLEGLQISRSTEVVSLIDKYYKISSDQFFKELAAVCDDDRATTTICKILQSVHQGDAQLLKSYLPHAGYHEGVDELIEVAERVDELVGGLGISLHYQLDGYIVRGLDYYTGTVFETFIDSYPDYGSVCSGGRYEDLTRHLDGKQSFSGVGGSIGVDRFMSRVFASGLIDTEQQVVQHEHYLCLHFPETYQQTVQLVGRLFADGKRIEIYPSPDKLKKQFSYADKSAATHVIIYGEEELAAGSYKVKELATGRELVVEL